MAVSIEKSDKTRRVQMDLTSESFDRLNRLKSISEATSYTEVMKDALRLYEYIIDEDQGGSKFFIRAPDGETTMVKIF